MCTIFTNMTANLNQSSSKDSILQDGDSDREYKNISLLTNTYVFFEVKTTYYNKNKNNNQNKIIDMCFAAVAREDIIKYDSLDSLKLDKRVKIFSFLVNPEHDDMSRRVRTETNLTKEILQKEPNFKSSFQKISSFLEQLEPPVCLVAETGFNFEILLAECTDANVSLPNHLQILQCFSCKNVIRRICKQNHENNSSSNEMLELKDFYLKFVGKEPGKMERAEKRSLALLEIVMALKKSFFTYSDKITKLLTEIRPLKRPSIPLDLHGKASGTPTNPTKHLLGSSAKLKRPLISEQEGPIDHSPLKRNMGENLNATPNVIMAGWHELDPNNHTSFTPQNPETSKKNTMISRPKTNVIQSSVDNSCSKEQGRVLAENECLFDVEIYRDDGLEVDDTLGSVIKNYLDHEIVKAVQGKTDSKCLKFYFARINPEGYFHVRPMRKESKDWLLSCDFSALGEPRLTAQSIALALVELCNTEEEKPLYEDPLFILKGQNTEREDLQISKWLLISKYTNANSSNSQKNTTLVVKVPKEAAAAWNILSVEKLNYGMSLINAKLIREREARTSAAIHVLSLKTQNKRAEVCAS